MALCGERNLPRLKSSKTEWDPDSIFGYEERLAQVTG